MRFVASTRTAAAVVAMVGVALAPAIGLTAAGAIAAMASPAGNPAAPAAWAARSSTPEPGHPAVDGSDPQGCDPLGGPVTRTDLCLLPYPNDYWTRADTTSATGRRVDIPVTVMPKGATGVPISPVDYDRSDGFSAGAQILADVPGMTSNDDLVPSHLPPVTDIAAYAAPDAGVVLLDTTTGARVPVWAELDQYAQGSDAAGTPYQHLLMVHPAANLVDGRRYVVGLRRLVRDDGSEAPSPAAFQAYVAGTAADARAPHIADVLATLAAAGVPSAGLYLAWDFTTASTRNVTGRLLAMRDNAFAQLGDGTPGDGMVDGHAPAHTVTSTSDATPAQDSRIGRTVKGTFTVPCYLTPTCTAASTGCADSTIVDYCTTAAQFALDPANPDAVPPPTPGQSYTAQFQCDIPRSVLADPARTARISLYGHGLFGSLGEVDAGNVKDMAAEHDVIECSTPWYGMAGGDVPTALAALPNLSLFPTIIDKVQEGELAFAYFARLMAHPGGLCADTAFQRPGGACLFDRAHPYYDGNSQGGIYGGTVCAIIPDVTRCVLGVSGMNYSVLLPRSSDYVAQHAVTQTDPTTVDPTDPTGAIGYSDAFDAGYPDQSQRILILDLLQTLWDRGDPNGYASHLTDHPLPGTPAHHVLMQIGYGDHQVANITAETEARTIGAHLLAPALEPGRSLDATPYWGIPVITPVPAHDPGSGITIFDGGPLRDDGHGGTAGTNPPPPADVPNRDGEDPHEAPRASVCGRIQKSDFLRQDGAVTDPCPGPKLDQGYAGEAAPDKVLPEAPYAAMLPVLALAVLAGGVALRRRRRPVEAARAVR